MTAENVQVEAGIIGDLHAFYWDRYDLFALHAIAKKYGLRQLWITPSALPFFGLPSTIGRSDRSGFLSTGGLKCPSTQSSLSPWLSCWDDSHYLEVSIPSWDRGSPWELLQFGPELLGELLEFTNATGMLWKRSGAITSDAWLRANCKDLAVTEYPDIARDANLEPDLRVVYPAEGERQRYCHAFDANAMYLGAASSLALPVGAMSNEGEVLGYWAKPGYWQNVEGVWITSPTRDFYNTAITRGVYWPESHRFLEGWYKALRDARSFLLPFGNTPALEAVKAVYRQGIGRLGSTNRSIDNDVLYQPYWRHAIQAEARTRLLRRVAALNLLPSARLCAVDVDCLYFLTSTPDPLNFAAKLNLPIGTGIGEFKVKGSTSGKLARGVITNPTLSAAMAELRSITQ